MAERWGNSGETEVEENGSIELMFRRLPHSLSRALLLGKGFDSMKSQSASQSPGWGSEQRIAVVGGNRLKNATLPPSPWGSAEDPRESSSVSEHASQGRDKR